MFHAAGEGGIVLADVQGAQARLDAVGGAAADPNVARARSSMLKLEGQVADAEAAGCPDATAP